MTFEEFTIDSHKKGQIWIWTALCVILLVPVSICVYYNAWPSVTAVLKGLLGVAPIYWTVGIIEIITFLIFTSVYIIIFINTIHKVTIIIIF